MSISAAFLAVMGDGAFVADTGISWWQTLGGLVAVFGLLLLFLKLLGKWNRRPGRGNSSLLTAWPLGPKREIQVLLLDDQVHYIYRHDGSMVVLKTEPRAEFENKQAAASA